MKMPNKILLGVFALTLAAVPASASFDMTSLDNQVQNHQAVLDNLKPRVNNAEKDIKALQDNTNTSPAANAEAVPAVPTPAPTQAAAPAVTPAPVAPPGPTVTIVNTKVIIGVDTYQPDPNQRVIIQSDQRVDWCKYTYDNGSISYDHSPVYEIANGTTWQCKPIGTVVPL